MLRFEVRGFPIVAHVHDEIVVEHPEITETVVEEVMAEPPRRAVELGLPITLKAWAGKRYSK
jgi:hypothetical protein